ncbi:hypothetical protein [Salisaeta longa]|uniref:hypothetical protein n=1 Tax=Salisaeta longa TaxID=503170 RepID=UPI0003B66A68|nr:hypothetical protein [Salisaeta longa]
MLAVALYVGGCGSAASSLDASKVKQAEEAAVPIITVDQYIDMSGMQESGGLASGSGAGAFMQRLLDDESFGLRPMVDLLHEKTYNVYAERLPVRFLPEDEVIGSTRYQQFQLLDDASSDARLQRVNRLLVPKNYKKYNLGQDALLADRQQKMFAAVPEGVDALLFVSANYAMVEDNPFWYWFLPISPDRAYVEATVRMEMINRNGETILEMSRTARSNNHLNTVGGISMEPEKIQGLCSEATKKAVAAIDVATKKALAGS